MNNYFTIPWGYLGHAQPTTPEPPPAPECRSTYRLKTPDEIGLHSYPFDEFGGREVIVRGWGTMDCVFIELPNGAEITAIDEWLVGTKHHSFVDTGTRRSWCRVCGTDAEWDWQQGAYQEKR